MPRHRRHVQALKGGKVTQSKANMTHDARKETCRNHVKTHNATEWGAHKGIERS